MPVHHRAYKYRIYPTVVQEQFLKTNFGCVRFVKNAMIKNFNSWSSVGPNPLPIGEKELKDNPQFPFLKEAISYALQQARMDIEETKKQYFNKKRKVKIGRMRFKKKGISRDSFRIPYASLTKNAIRLDVGIIYLPKLKTGIKMMVDRKFSGNPKSITVSMNKSGQYFVSILIEEEIEIKPNTNRSIGIDLGLNHLIVLSDGTKIENPRWFRENQSKLKRAQQHLSRKSKGSNRYNRQRIKVARIHNKIKNQREFIQHNLSSWLVNNYDHIFMENLNIKGMVQNRRLAKSILDASFGSLTRTIEYKSNWAGRTFHKIDRFFPSSKTCSCCGHKLASLSLDVREWDCPSCGTHHDRDINAAKNILAKGFEEMYSLTSDELADYRRREEIRPKEFVPMASSLKRLVVNPVN